MEIAESRKFFIRKQKKGLSLHRKKTGMKKGIILLLLSLLPAVLKADERGENILRRMAAAFGSYTGYRIEFTATMAGEFTDLPGELIVSGEKYYLDVYDSKIFYDGRTGYTYSETNNEVILEIPDPDDYRLFANPTRIFHLYEQDYTATFKNRTTLNGKNTDRIELTPKSAAENHLILYADPANGMPVRMVYRLREYDKELTLDILKIDPDIPVTPQQFIFNPANYPGVEIIDFR